MWSLPCKTNGLLSHFNVQINGTSTIDAATDFNSTTVEADSENNYLYGFNYNFTNAAYNYNIDVTVVLESGQESASAGVQFLTPDGCKCYKTKQSSSVMIVFNFDVYTESDQ